MSLTDEHIQARLDDWLQTEFTFLRVERIAAELATLPRKEQDFVLDWTRRVASANIQIAYEFAQRSADLLARTDRHLLEAWALHAMDRYDSSGLRAGLAVITDIDRFLHQRHERAVGVVLEEVQGVLLTFVRGLSGRPLKLEAGEAVYTDSETLYLPRVLAERPSEKDNFTLGKAMVTLLWAQTRFGTFRVDLSEALAAYPDPEYALAWFHALETRRLEACIERELPGMFREMMRLKGSEPREAIIPATVEEVLARLPEVYDQPLPPAACYQGELRPEAVARCRAARMEREKMLLRVKLAELAADSPRHRQDESPPKRPEFKAHSDSHEDSLSAWELTLDDLPVAPPESVRQLLTSIQLDWGEIPPEHLVPAGAGEYDPALLREEKPDPDSVWQGTYHEEGATLYPEWDFARGHYRKDWCVMREKDVEPVYDDFAAGVLAKYTGLARRLRRTFEAMRDEDRLLKRQTQGEEVDIDALVEALAEARDGREMNDRLFTRMHRAERNIAVLFMVDMSGSTQGWINDAERESLVLLCEALEILGDRYGIYGFSGMTRKRCELFHIKHLDEAYTDTVRARISGIRPQDYTRMGFAIRHLTSLLKQSDARTRLLITLSDGKPDDYNDYRGTYGIEDTRRALIEARRDGIHPYCITIDEKARDYLPHLYGPAAFTLVDDVRRLPFKVSDIYRRLTA